MKIFLQQETVPVETGRAWESPSVVPLPFVQTSSSMSSQLYPSVISFFGRLVHDFGVFSQSRLEVDLQVGQISSRVPTVIRSNIKERKTAPAEFLA